MSLRVNVLEAGEICSALRLLEGALRGGERVPEAFAERLRDAVRSGELEFLEARRGERPAGVALVAYRPSVSAGGPFASIEELQVLPAERRKGVGRALLLEVARRCAARGVSYVEVEVEEQGARSFYEALGYELEEGVDVLSRSHAVADPGGRGF